MTLCLQLALSNLLSERYHCTIKIDKISLAPGRNWKTQVFFLHLVTNSVLVFYFVWTHRLSKHFNALVRHVASHEGRMFDGIHRKQFI